MSGRKSVLACAAVATVIACANARSSTPRVQPGELPQSWYAGDTAAFARCIDRLSVFANEHLVVHFLGAHIENSREPGRDYPQGTLDQPDEHVLQMNRAQLFQLDSAVRAMRGRFARTVLPDFTIWPLP